MSDGDPVIVGGHVACQLVYGQAGGVDDAARCSHNRNACHLLAICVNEVMKVFLRTRPSTSGLLRNRFESKTNHVIGESHEAVAMRGASFTQLHANWPRAT